MEFTWGGNFLSEKLHNKAMQRNSDFSEDGTIFLSKIPQPPRESTGVPLILAHSRKIKNSFVSSVLNSSFVCQNDLSHSKSPPVIIIMTDLEH